ncbi:MAG: hypothetical protein ACRDRH_05600 [Pseudonocardia sp.]
MAPAPPPTERPAGVEYKAAALATAPPADPPRPAPAMREVDAVVLPTGIPVGGDVFLPGSLARAVARTMPKATVADDWNRPVGALRAAVELPPADPRLPATLPDGRPWPARAGALLVRIAYMQGTADGRLAHKAASSARDPADYTVGFRVISSRRRAGLRMISDLDIYTISPRVPGGPTALAAKHAPVTGIEVKAVRAVARHPLMQTQACWGCGQPALAAVGHLPDSRLVCTDCLAAYDRDGAASGRLFIPAPCWGCGQLAAASFAPLPGTVPTLCTSCSDVYNGRAVATGYLSPEVLAAVNQIDEPDAEGYYENALASDVDWAATADGTLVRDDADPAQGRAWGQDTRRAWGRP